MYCKILLIYKKKKFHFHESFQNLNEVFTGSNNNSDFTPHSQHYGHDLNLHHHSYMKKFHESMQMKIYQCSISMAFKHKDNGRKR